MIKISTRNILLFSVACMGVAVWVFAPQRKSVDNPSQNQMEPEQPLNITRSTPTPTSIIPMNEKHRAILEAYKECDQKTSDLEAKIQEKIPEKINPYGKHNRDQALKYISEPEWVYLNLLSFFAGCENQGTLHRDAWTGYFLREYMLEAGIKDCAEVFLRLHPIQVEMDDFDTKSEEEPMSDDEYGEGAERITAKMEKIEKDLPSEGWEEINVLLWKYAQKHGLDKNLTP